MQVRIYRPAGSPMQSACPCAQRWQIAPIRQTPRGQDQIMGWTSASDPLSALTGRLLFETMDQAVAFARTRGWVYVIDAPAARQIRPRSYVDNFNPDRRRSGR